MWYLLDFHKNSKIFNNLILKTTFKNTVFFRTLKKKNPSKDGKQSTFIILLLYTMRFLNHFTFTKSTNQDSYTFS